MSPRLKHEWKESRTSRLCKLLAVLVVFSLGLWGCARKPAPRSSADRIRQLENRCNRLEQEYRNVAASRERARRELAEARRDKVRLQKELVEAKDGGSDRDDLLAQVKAALAERDALKKRLAQTVQKRDDLQQQLVVRVNERELLLGRVERLRKGLLGVVKEDEAQFPSSPTVSLPAANEAGNEPVLAGPGSGAEQ